ncbi:MAG: cobalamin-dependent protein [Desulfobacterales bacterium]|nr:MAG: cobalamin-dependent protein [Desulfobacterales bacterium]
MRCLLINPYYPISETPSPPLGLAYLAAALAAAGVEVKILDLVVFPYSQPRLALLLQSFRPQMVGLTAVTMTFDSAINVVKDIKQIDPGIFAVMGGPHVTFCAEETLKNFPELDCIVLGEGEETIVDLAHAVQRDHGWNNVNGIAYRQGTAVRLTRPRQLIQDLDRLPVPARHLLPLGRYRALGMPISLTTSRGCPFKCIFCVGRKMVGARVRYRRPEKVVDEMEDLNRLNFHQINIADDLFTANAGHCLAVCDEIVRRGLQVKWTSFARVDTVSETLLHRMHAAGCRAVSFGIESGNAQILKTIKKGITTEQVMVAVAMCKRTGITPYASFILGLPGETPQTLKETLAFGERLKEMGLAYGFHLLAPFPGTEVREKSARFNLKILTDDWSQYHANRAIVETPSVTRQMLDDIVIQWEREFNDMLADIQSRMREAKASPEEAWQITNLERIVFIYDAMMKNLIEENGCWRHDGHSLSPEEALRILAGRIDPSPASPSETVYQNLNDAMQRGNLKFTHHNGQIQWQWVDFL